MRKLIGFSIQNYPEGITQETKEYRETNSWTFKMLNLSIMSERKERARLTNSCPEKEILHNQELGISIWK